MARTLEELVIKLSADNADLKRKLSQSGAEVREFASNALSSFRSLKTSIAQFGSAIAGAFVVRELGQFIKAAVDLGGSLNDTATRLGVTAEALQVYREQAGEAGVDSGAVDSSLQGLSKTLGQLHAGFGRATKQLELLDPQLLASLKSAKSVDEAYRLVAESVRDAAASGDEQRAAAIAAATGMSPLLGVLKDGAKAFDDFGERAKASGLILSNDAVASLDTFGEALDRVKKASVVGFAEGLAGLDSSLTDLNTKLSDPEMLAAINDLSQGFGRLVSKLIDFVEWSAAASRSPFWRGTAQSIFGKFAVPDLPDTSRNTHEPLGRDFVGAPLNPGIDLANATTAQLAELLGGGSSTGSRPPGRPRGTKGGSSKSKGNKTPDLAYEITHWDYFAEEKKSFKDMVDGFDKGMKEMRKASEEFADEGIEHWRNMQDAAETFGSFAGNAFSSLVRDGKLDFKSLALSFAETMVEMSARASALKLFEASSASSGGKGIGGFFASIFSAIGLADGGVVTRPTLAMIGEGGEPEAVIPLSKMRGRAPVVNIINSGTPLEVTGTRRNERDEIDVMVESSWNRQRSRGAFKTALGSRHAPGPG